jgi:phosphatidate cytidylyltransferase
MVIGFGLMLFFCGRVYHINSYGLKENLSLPLSAAGFALLLIGIFQKNAIRLKAFGMAALGLIYISLCWGLMMDLYEGKGFHLHNTSFVFGVKFFPLVIIVSIWINDTMAYLFGSLFGKTPLSKISPKKTWEGTLGGIIMSAVLIGLSTPVIYHNVFTKIIQWMMFSIGLIASITGTFGDLLESKLKRMANVKDSGSLMPGHGGFLDRFDSLLLATPFVWLSVNLFMK